MISIRYQVITCFRGRLKHQSVGKRVLLIWTEQGDTISRPPNPHLTPLAIIWKDAKCVILANYVQPCYSDLERFGAWNLLNLQAPGFLFKTFFPPSALPPPFFSFSLFCFVTSSGAQILLQCFQRSLLGTYGVRVIKLRLKGKDPPPSVLSLAITSFLRNDQTVSPLYFLCHIFFPHRVCLLHWLSCSHSWLLCSMRVALLLSFSACPGLVIMPTYHFSSDFRALWCYGVTIVCSA